MDLSEPNISNDRTQPTNSQFILYQDDNGVTNVNVRFDDNCVWLSQQQIAMLLDTTQQNISLYIHSIIERGGVVKGSNSQVLLVSSSGR